MIKYIFILLIISGLYACQKSGVDSGSNNIANLSFDSLKSISVNIPDDDYNDLIFINEQIGIAGSRFGKIIRTTDGGNNWSQMNLPAIPGLQIKKFQFTDNNTGYAVAVSYPPGTSQHFGVLLRTTDAGANWIQVTTPPGAQFESLYFFDNQNGFLSGYNLYKTTNGGQTWTTTTGMLANKINFKNRNEGIVTAQNGTFHKTIDGGVTWDTTRTSYSDLFYDIYFTNTKTFVTRLGFPSLVDISNPSLNSPKPFEAEKLFFLDDQKCIGIGKLWSGGWLTEGAVHLTNDCWNTSDRKIFGQSEKFTAIAKVNDHKIMILGLRGGITLVITYHY